jgi:predicted DNA-binding protein
MADKPRGDKKQEDMVRMTFYIGPDSKTRLENLSKQTDRTVAIMIRRAIDAYLEAEEAALRKRK